MEYERKQAGALAGRGQTSTVTCCKRAPLALEKKTEAKARRDERKKSDEEAD